MSEKINTVISRIRTNEEERKYFFRVSPTYANLNLWLSPLSEEGYFNPDSKHLHGAIFFLEAVAKQNQAKPLETTANQLLEIINNYIGYRNKSNMEAGDYYIDWFMLKIAFLLPHDLLGLAHIEFIRKSISEYDGVLDGELGKIFIPHLLQYNKKEHLLSVVNILFGCKAGNDKDEIPLIKDYWLNDILEKHSMQVAKCVGIDGYNMILHAIQSKLGKKQKSFSLFEINAIERSSDIVSHSNRHNRYMIYFMRDILENLSNEELKPIICELLAMEHPIFKRLAIHTLNSKYEIFKDIFWGWFTTINGTADIGKHELYMLFKQRANVFSDEEMQIVLHWIENLHLNYDEDENKKVYFEAYRKKEWLIPLKAHSKEATELYGKYDAINNGEVEYPGFDYYMDIGWAEYESPVATERLESMSASDIASFIKSDFVPSSHRTKRIWSDNDAIDGLADALSGHISKNPSKFLINIDEFLDLDHKYIYHVLYGFYSTLKDEKSFEWKNLLGFIKKLLSDDFFSSEHPQTNWIAGLTAEIIDIGVKTMTQDAELPKAKQILLTLEAKTKNENIQEFSDIVATTINTIKGKVFGALISYSVRVAKLNAATESKWDADVKKLFSQQINNTTEQNVLFFSTLGMYLQNLLYLDKDWVFDNFDKIFPLDNERPWKASIESYLYVASSVYEVIYKRFNDGGHIDKIISSYTASEHIVERIVQHICVAFINDFDNKKIFEILNLNCEMTENIIDFMWDAYRGSKGGSVTNKVFELWKEIYEKYCSLENEETKLIFSNLTKWFVFINEINSDNIEILKKCAREASHEHNDYFLIDELLRLSDNYSAECADIFLARLENLPAPDYPQEDIANLVTIFFSNENSRQKADEICAKYAKSGNFILRDLQPKV
ncbi:MAG: hypothetical protein AB7D29_09550 [Campylobacterales bacterium]